MTLLENKILIKLILFLSPLLLYLNTLNNDFALDDAIVYSENSFVRQGLKGIDDIFTTETFTGFFQQSKDLVEGGRYRPLSVASFAVEYALYGLQPGISHLINALLYALLCIVLFNTLRKILGRIGMKEQIVSIAFIASMLFIFHPVHTEVVANIKGRDELFSVLFLLLSLNLVIQYFDKEKLLHALMAALSLFIALLSKENAIFFWPILIILLLLDKQKLQIRKLYLPLLFMLTATLAYLKIRIIVVGGLTSPGSMELMNNPYLHAGLGQKLPTIFHTLLLYIKLLFIPHPLTYDYYPYHIKLQDWSSLSSLAGLSIYMVLAALSIYYYRTNKVLCFGISFYLVTLFPMTNLIVNIGSFMNERFLFLPSIGFALCAAYFFNKLLNSARSMRAGITVLMVTMGVVFGIKTVVRNTHWKNNYTLFTHDVKVSSGSAKSNCSAGGILYERAIATKNTEERKRQLKQSVNYLEQSLRIYPEYIDALLLIGNAHFALDQNIQMSEKYYARLFELAPQYSLAQENYTKILSQAQDAEIRRRGFSHLIRLNKNNFEAYYQLGVTYGKMLNQLDTATYYFDKALAIKPNSKLANRDMGVALAMQGRYKESIPYFEKVIKLSPNEKANYINLGLSYQGIGENEKAYALFRKAETLDK